MLRPVETFLSVPVMSLQTGAELARTTGIIVDPRQLTVVALYVDGPLVSEHPSILHPSDIRDISAIGFIIDDESKLMSLEGLVRLREIIDFEFELIGLKVVDEDGKKHGKVSTFVINPETFTIEQLSTSQSILKSLGTVGRVINRSQIVSVSNEKIVVKSTRITDEVKETARQATQQFINPFRGNEQPEG